MTPNALKAAGTPFLYWSFAKLPGDAQYAVVSKAREGGDPGLLFLGGDMFVVDPKGRDVSYIIRNFMGTRPEGLLGLVRENDPHCESDVLPEDAATLWTADLPGLAAQYDGYTPKSVAGAITVSPRQAACLLRKEGDRSIILSALNYRWGLPGALGVNWAGAWGSSADDRVGAKLAAEVLALPHASRESPIIVYCRDRDCWLSVNVVKRLVAAGFSRVYWLRDGIQGWMRQSGPTSAIRLLPSPLSPDDIQTPPPVVAKTDDDWSHVETLDGSAEADIPGAFFRLAKTRHVAQGIVTDYSVNSDHVQAEQFFTLKVSDFSSAPGFDPLEELDSVFRPKAERISVSGHTAFRYRHHENRVSVVWVAVVEAKRLIVLYARVADGNTGEGPGRAVVDRYASSLVVH